MLGHFALIGGIQTIPQQIRGSSKLNGLAAAAVIKKARD
jgi:hypothetical protein